MAVDLGIIESTLNEVSLKQLYTYTMESMNCINAQALSNPPAALMCYSPRPLDLLKAVVYAFNYYLYNNTTCRLV